MRNTSLPGWLAVASGMAILVMMTESGWPYHTQEDSLRQKEEIELQSNAQEFLYTIIQSWSTPSHRTKSLPVRRNGDPLLFLNNLCHQVTALRLRIPLTRKDVSAVVAMRRCEDCLLAVTKLSGEVKP